MSHNRNRNRLLLPTHLSKTGPNRKKPIEPVLFGPVAVQQLVLTSLFEVFTLPHRFLPESAGMTGFRRIPAELFLAEGPAKFAIPGTTYSGGIEPFRN
jgi:hypothetical protein